MGLKTNNCIELVGNGHPDRFADYLAESILEFITTRDKNAKVAIEILATSKCIVIGGEVSTTIDVGYKEITYKAIEEIYSNKWWPNYKEEVEVIDKVVEQSAELNEIQSSEIVAGDQGVIYGYYDKERFNTIDKLYEIMNRVSSKFELAPDWKLLYNLKDNELSMSVCGDVDHNLVKKYVEIIANEINLFSNEIIVNPKGKWLIPGPLADTGVVGRKLMIDTFGAGIPHGGGAFCGKDVSKVDKTGILWATKIAEEYSSNNNLIEVLVELNFKIGDSYPKVFVNGDCIEVNQTLNEFIDEYNIKNNKWSELVINGSSVLSWLKGVNK